MADQITLACWSDTYAEIMSDCPMDVRGQGSCMTHEEAQRLTCLKLGITEDYAIERGFIQEEEKKKFLSLPEESEGGNQNAQLTQENARLKEEIARLERMIIKLQEKVQRMEQIAQRVPQRRLRLGPPTFGKSPSGDGDAEMPSYENISHGDVHSEMNDTPGNDTSQDVDAFGNPSFMGDEMTASSAELAEKRFLESFKNKDNYKKNIKIYII